MWVRPNRPDLDAIKVPTAIDIAWSAGIYEGEGNCRLCGGGEGKRGFMVSIAQKDPELLYRMRDWFGGSVRGNGAGTGVHALNICGDRARVFTALIYRFLTVRRKVQVDATGALDVFGGPSCAALSADELRSKMLAYYEEHFAGTQRNPVARRKKQAERYRQGMGDPEFRESIRQRSQQQRDNMTPEQKEASRKYQQAYYQNHKNKTHIVSIEKTA